MNYFLVDYENVNVVGLDGITKLSEDDVVIIFYSENAETLTFGMHKKINESKAEIKFQKVAVPEKNALDFQLCSYLGFLIRDVMSNENIYYIVSNDKGYTVLPNYWKKKGFEVKVVSNLKKDSNPVTQVVKPVEVKIIAPQTELEKVLSKILPNKTDISEVEKIIKNSKTKVEVNNNIGKKFSSSKQGEIYKAIKPLLTDKK